MHLRWIARKREWIVKGRELREERRARVVLPIEVLTVHV